MRLVRYQAAGAGVGAARPDGSLVTTPWPDFGALFAEPDPRCGPGDWWWPSRCSMPYLWGAVIGPDDDIIIPTEDTQTEAWLIVVPDPDGHRLRLYTLETHGPELTRDEDNPWVRSA